MTPINIKIPATIPICNAGLLARREINVDSSVAILPTNVNTAGVVVNINSLNFILTKYVLAQSI